MVEVVSQAYELFSSNACCEPESGLSAAPNFPGDKATRGGLMLMRSEALRLRSYINWPSHLSQRPPSLAKAGLFYTGREDRVKCAFCLGVLKNWLPSDDPLTEHRLLFPHCGFVLGHNVGNIPLFHVKTEPDTKTNTHSGMTIYRNNEEEIKPTEVVSKPNQTTTLKPLKQKELDTAKEPSGTTISPVLNTKPEIDYSKEAVRHESFKNWPVAVSQTPESLAYAGFYHFPSEEKPDRVRCAYCQGKLYNWRIDDDPMMEHARCFPTCPYIKLCMGEQLIDDLLHQHEQINKLDQQETVDHVDAVESKPQAVISAVLEMGFPKQLVTKVADKFSKENLRDVTVSQMVDRLLGNDEKKSRLACTLKPLKIPGDQQANEIATRHSEITSRWSMGDEHGCGRVTTPGIPQARIYMCMEEDTSLRNRCAYMPCGHEAIFGQYSMSTRNCPECGEVLIGTVFM